MLFNSFEFALFLPVVFLLYWFVFNRSLRVQNLFVVGASYLFYGWWDWRFLLLIAFTSLCSYASGLLIGRFRKRRGGERWSRAVNAGNILLNLTILGVFKYYDFFAASFAELFGIADYDSLLLRIILPVGISFYTFQALSYSIDVYREKLAPTRDIVAFFAFISFFPQLVAGPIERATNLLPQFLRPRTFDTAQAVDGLRQALWGFFKKIVVADNCAILANGIFDNYENLSGGALVIGAVAFSFQIYGDFSGYSDIAIGISRLFGFSLMRNFNYPYFSRDIAEFWRRWHISLTTWFRDYIYIPLGGSRGSKWMVFRNTRVLARRELDIHRLGRLPRAVVPAADPLGAQPPVHRGDRRGTHPADGTGGPANRIDLRAGGRGMDHLPRRNHRRRLALRAENLLAGDSRPRGARRQLRVARHPCRRRGGDPAGGRMEPADPPARTPADRTGAHQPPKRALRHLLPADSGHLRHARPAADVHLFPILILP